jgi:hypothetical protein
MVVLRLKVSVAAKITLHATFFDTANQYSFGGSFSAKEGSDCSYVCSGTRRDVPPLRLRACLS